MSENTIGLDVEVQFEGERSYYTTVPNIIFSLGLDPYAFMYYCTLRKTAGEKGSCFKSKETLSEESGCSYRLISELNNYLSQPFEALGGKPLIRVESQFKSDGSQATNRITIIDVWLENITNLSNKNKIPKTPRQIQLKKTKSTDKNPGAIFAPPPHAPDARPPTHQMHDPHAPDAHKEEPYEEEPLFKNTTNPTLPPASSTNKPLSGLVGGFSSIEENRTTQKPYACLTGLELSEKDKMRITSMFSEDLVINAVAFCLKKKDKLTKMDGSIIYYCKNPHHIVESKEEIEQKKLNEKQLHQEKINHRKQLTDSLSRRLHKFCMETGKRIHAGHLGSDYVEINSESGQEKIYYDNDRFKAMIEHVLRKFEFPIPQQFLDCLV